MTETFIFIKCKNPKATIGHIIIEWVCMLSMDRIFFHVEHKMNSSFSHQCRHTYEHDLQYTGTCGCIQQESHIFCLIKFFQKLAGIILLDFWRLYVYNFIHALEKSPKRAKLNLHRAKALEQAFWRLLFFKSAFCLGCSL